MEKIDSKDSLKKFLLIDTKYTPPSFSFPNTFQTRLQPLSLAAVALLRRYQKSEDMLPIGAVSM